MAEIKFPIELTITGRPVVKKNSMQIARKRNSRLFLIANRLYKRWEDKAVLELKARWQNKPPIPKTTKLNAKIVSYQGKNQRCDASNLYEAPQDALQKAGVIENDSCIISHDGSRRLSDPLHPRVEITLTEVTP